MQFIIPFLIGVIIAALVVLVIGWIILSRAESRRKSDSELIIERLQQILPGISLDVQRQVVDHFLDVGKLELDSKKQLIDQTLKSMAEELGSVQELVRALEKDRQEKFGELSSQLRIAAEQTSKLQETTADLRNALATTRVRGQWGERMADDVLRMAGFIEGKNYLKQKSLEAGTGRPDYTFLLPQDLKLNMDVKFPLDNYLCYLEAESDPERETYKSRFLKDVRARVKEVTTRDYISPEDNTVDCVIVFIPNEQVYGFIHENDGAILDEALRNKVVLCSPLTLYPILAVVRQAIDNFNLERSTTQIISLMGAFNKQWKSFTDSLETVGKRIDDAQAEFGHLMSTRRRQVQKPLDKIEELRQQVGIPIEESTLLPARSRSH